jgi:hypothetical protein
VGVAQRRGPRGSVKGLRRGSASTALGVPSCGAARRGDAELEELSRRPAEGDAELEELSRARRQCHALICLLKGGGERDEATQSSKSPAVAPPPATQSSGSSGVLRAHQKTRAHTKLTRAHTAHN